MFSAESIELIIRSINDENSIDNLDATLDVFMDGSILTKEEKHELLVKGWIQAAENFLDDGVIEEREEEKLVKLVNKFGLSRDELDTEGAWSRVAKAGAIRDLLNGIIPKRFTFNGDLPINLLRAEQLVWAFLGVEYFEDRTKREFVGRSQGVSIRVMRGVYYRFGAFKGKPVETTSRTYIATGTLFVTNLNLYFYSSSTAFRVPFKKIVSFESFTDGIGIVRDAASAKPQVFVTGDGWFTYNIIVNLAKM